MKPFALSVSGASEALNLSAQIVRAMCARGDFPGARRITSGKRSHWRIPIAALEKWFDMQQPKTSSTPSVDRKSRHDALRIYKKKS